MVASVSNITLAIDTVFSRAMRNDLGWINNPGLDQIDVSLARSIEPSLPLLTNMRAITIVGADQRRQVVTLRKSLMLTRH
jgi:hypothetical protein